MVSGRLYVHVHQFFDIQDVFCGVGRMGDLIIVRSDDGVRKKTEMDRWIDVTSLFGDLHVGLTMMYIDARGWRAVGIIAARKLIDKEPLLILEGGIMVTRPANSKLFVACIVE